MKILNIDKMLKMKDYIERIQIKEMENSKQEKGIWYYLNRVPIIIPIVIPIIKYRKK